MKVPFQTDKRQWHPSLIPGTVVLVSSMNRSGEPNLAPKSWIQMVSFEPSILMFSGTKDNSTERNILETGFFGINFVNTSMVERVFECITWKGAERVHRLGLDLERGALTGVPLVRQSPASIECRLIETKEMGSGFLIFGEIVAASVSEEIAKEPDLLKKYELLDQVLFLENQIFGRNIKACKI